MEIFSHEGQIPAWGEGPVRRLDSSSFVPTALPTRTIFRMSDIVFSDEEDDDIPDEEEYEISDEGDENDERDGEGQDFDTDQESKTSSFRLQISSINKNELLTMKNCIVNTNQLLQLAQAPVITTCNKDECRSRVKIEQKYYGTRVVLQWVTIISSD